MSEKAGLYGMMLEFDQPEPLLKAARLAYESGFRDLDAFTPYPVEELAESIGFTRDRVSLITLLSGAAGGTLAFVMQWYANVIDYPINVAGRPNFSWPAFIPVTFELTVLGAAFGAAFGMLALNRLPKLWHPAFELPAFVRASSDRFFLCVQASDPLYSSAKIRALFGQSQALSIEEVSIES